MDPEPSTDVVRGLLANLPEAEAGLVSALGENRQRNGGSIGSPVFVARGQRREVRRRGGESLIAELQKHPPESVTVVGPMGDSEALRFAETLKDLLGRAGWSCEGVGPLVVESTVKEPIVGVIVQMAHETEGLMTLTAWLKGVTPQARGGSLAAFHENRIIIAGAPPRVGLL